MQFDGARLTAIREARQLTQEQLGRLVGLSEAAISRFEGGSRTPKGEVVQRIAKELKCDVLALSSPEAAEAVA